MSQCKICLSQEDIVHSGVDALLLGIDGAETGTKCYPCANKQRTEVSKEIKGSSLALGNKVSLVIRNKDAVATDIQGEITALQKFNGQIWVQIAGIDSWIILTDAVEIGVL